jgi:hypothetical protein
MATRGSDEETPAFFAPMQSDFSELRSQVRFINANLNQTL